MSIGLTIALLFATLLMLLVLGTPFAFAIGATALIFGFFLWGPNSLYLLALSTYRTMVSILFLAIPLFILMGNLLQRSGIADELYGLMYNSLGRLRGGLAAGTVLICTIFAAMTGISGAATVSMGIIALPSMLKRNYNKQIALGCISAGGALGQLIPPSVIMIIYGAVGGVSIGKLFAGGIFPGLLLSALFIIYIFTRCGLNAKLGPALPLEQRASLRVMVSRLPALILPLILIVAVLGSIFSGAATPTEASAVGAFGAIICTAINRSLNWQLVMECCRETLKLTAMIMWIIVAAIWLASVFAGFGGVIFVSQFVESLGVSPWVVLIGIQALLVIMGMFMETAGIILITMPVLFPIIKACNFDPVWFGILFVMNAEMGLLTPPFGINLFYMRAIVPPGVTMGDIYRSIVPFVLLQLTGLIIVILFPQIATFLPSLLFQS